MKSLCVPNSIWVYIFLQSQVKISNTGLFDLLCVSKFCSIEMIWKGVTEIFVQFDECYSVITSSLSTQYIAKFLSNKENIYGNKNKYNHPLLKFVEIIPLHNNIYTPWILIHWSIWSWGVLKNVQRSKEMFGPTRAKIFCILHWAPTYNNKHIVPLI